MGTGFIRPGRKHGVVGDRPPNQSQDYLFENLGRALDHCSENFENFMFIGDFNMTETEELLKDFLDPYSLKNLVHEPTCYKSETATCA